MPDKKEILTGLSVQPLRRSKPEQAVWEIEGRRSFWGGDIYRKLAEADSQQLLISAMRRHKIGVLFNHSVQGRPTLNNLWSQTTFDRPLGDDLVVDVYAAKDVVWDVKADIPTDDSTVFTAQALNRFEDQGLEEFFELLPTSRMVWNHRENGMRRMTIMDGRRMVMKPDTDNRWVGFDNDLIITWEDFANNCLRCVTRTFDSE